MVAPERQPPSTLSRNHETSPSLKTLSIYPEMHEEGVIRSDQESGGEVFHSLSK